MILVGILIMLAILAVFMWGGQSALAGLGAPGWLVNVLIAIVIIIILVLIAQMLGAPIPGLGK